MTSIAAREVDPLSGKPIEIGRTDVRLVVRFTPGLGIWSDGAPAHIVDVEVKDVRPRSLCVERCRGGKAEEGDEMELHSLSRGRDFRRNPP